MVSNVVIVRSSDICDSSHAGLPTPVIRMSFGDRNLASAIAYRQLGMRLNLDISRSEPITVVRCRGRIVFGEESDELRRVVLDLLKETKGIVLVLDSIQMMDSYGLGTLVSLFTSARNRGAEIKFADLSPITQRIFTTTNADRLFEIYNAPEDAIRSFHSHKEAASR